MSMKLLGAKLRGIFAKFSEALPPSFAKATEGSPHLHPRSKPRGIRRRRINKPTSQAGFYPALDQRGCSPPLETHNVVSASRGEVYIESKIKAGPAEIK
jgi:hypothetical protein